MGNEDKISYSEALIARSVPHRMIAAYPLAFGEVGVKERVKSALNYKKPAFWIVVIAVVASIILAVCFLTNPYAQEIRADSIIYTQQGGNITKSPEGYTEIGVLRGGAHQTKEESGGIRWRLLRRQS